MQTKKFASWNELDVQIAHLWRNGCDGIVPNTHHIFEVDDPPSVVDAVFEVIAEFQARGNRDRTLRSIADFVAPSRIDNLGINYRL